jgi:uncharacterized protein (TIGR03437 family)
MISGRTVFFRRYFLVLFAALGGCCGECCAQTLLAPSYSAQSIVHAATQTVQALAPNTIATIYGANLSFDTVVAANTVIGSTLPESLDGVTVVVQGLIAPLFFVSPTQINFLVPYDLTAGTVTLFVAHQALAGPVVQIQLNSTAPGFFQYNNLVIATHLNGSLLSTAAPGNGGEIIVIYIAGLGRVSPDTTSGKLANFAASIVPAALSQTQVLLAGVPCPQSSVLYVGLAPGFAGLYQINLVVPAMTPANPEVRVQVGSQISPAGTIIAVN